MHTLSPFVKFIHFIHLVWLDLPSKHLYQKPNLFNALHCQFVAASLPVHSMRTFKECPNLYPHSLVVPAHAPILPRAKPWHAASPHPNPPHTRPAFSTPG